MTWRSDDRVNQQGYTNNHERQAFRAGYSDAFLEYDMWSGNARDWFPEAYRAGYDAGSKDKKDGKS